MRRRGVLFSLLGAFLILAAFRPSLQVIAFIAGFVSVLSLKERDPTGGQPVVNIRGLKMG